MKTAQDLLTGEEPASGLYCRQCIRLAPFEAVNVYNGGELATFCCDHCGRRNDIIGWAARWLATRPNTHLMEEGACLSTGATW